IAHSATQCLPEVLETLAADGADIAELVLNWRHYSKLLSTYVDALPKSVNNHTKRIHTTFLQTITTTGRLSSVEPNLQNIPIRTSEGQQLRYAFTAKTGYRLISADYSQIELRLLASMADITSLKQAFADGCDIHKTTASEIFSIALKDVDSEYRRRAKAINFGIIYGISPYGLAKQLAISTTDAKGYIDKYFATYPGIYNYMQDTIKIARQDGLVKTLLGRIIRLPQINSSNFSLRSFAERAAINAPLQGTAADIMKVAMLSVEQYLTRSDISAHILLQIHDELIIECQADSVTDCCGQLPQLMNQHPHLPKLDVPLVIDVNQGNSWGEL
ncbi:MAG: DNA polymerase, partial [Pseudomonadota bacterium]